MRAMIGPDPQDLDAHREQIEFLEDAHSEWDGDQADAIRGAITVMKAAWTFVHAADRLNWSPREDHVDGADDCVSCDIDRELMAERDRALAALRKALGIRDPEATHGGAFDYEALDPGIRGVVMWLHSKGYVTTDSGDGVSKPTDEEWSNGARHDEGTRVCDIPHVAIRVTPEELVNQTCRLWGLLASEFGIRSVPAGPADGVSRVEIMASFDPALSSSRTGFIMLTGLTTEMLKR